MVHCIVRYRQIDKSGSCDHTPLVDILYVLSEVQQLDDAWLSGPKICLFFDEMSINNWSYSVKYKSFIELKRVT